MTAVPSAAPSSVSPFRPIESPVYTPCPCPRPLVPAPPTTCRPLRPLHLVPYPAYHGHTLVCFRAAHVVPMPANFFLLLALPSLLP